MGALDPNSSRYKELEDELNQIKTSLQENSNYGGTKGFRNYGVGTPAMLHGSEAVVPESSPAGNILKSANTTRVAEALSSMSGSGAGGGIVYVDNSDNSSSVVSKGATSPISLPGSDTAVDMGFHRKFTSLMGNGHSVGNMY
jgi:hypothetical protein